MNVEGFRDEEGKENVEVPFDTCDKFDNDDESDQDPTVESRRTFDDFLEAGFQATKGLAAPLYASPPPTTTATSSSTSYHTIGSSHNPLNDAVSVNISNIPNSSGIHIASFCRQWRYWCILLSLGVANSSDATEILCISYMLGDPVFRSNMLGEREGGDGASHGSGLLAAAVFLGMLLGGLVVGTMGDWIGRKPMLLLGLSCNSVAGVLSALAPSLYALALLRCIAGVGIGATVPPLFTLATELAPPSARGVCVTVCASFWMVGSIYVALVALWCFEGPAADASDAAALAIATWRVFAFICAAPSALGAALVYWLVPESPRFLGIEGRSEEAVAIANSLVCSMNGGSESGIAVPPLTIEELEDTFPLSALRDLEDRQLLNGGSDRGMPESGVSGRGVEALAFLEATASDFVRSTSKLYEPNLRRTTWPLQLVWFSLSFGTYGLLTWINLLFEKVNLENVYVNALLFAAANLPGNLLSALLMDRIGRSTSLIGSIACASVSLMLFALSAVWTNPTGIVLSACLFQCFTVAAWNTIDTMTSELFPTLVRSTGLGMCAASGRIGALIAQFVNDALVEKPVRLLLVASGTLLLGAVTPCLLPGDMTGRPVHDDMGTGGRNPGRIFQRKNSGTRCLGNERHPSINSQTSDTVSGTVVQRVSRR
ncbi:unnamed protein product [Pseudo-nitzschia multistriata]|uniref:Major facilitator superfamily (MFS) profile domain-containing protein n=1 Tax=Pseudo-nitzschia multistriata TaxID=183589 RepID=A0A448Z9U0_9STRA|nr:unnamed protein product [Pseudo-nitzschia multistriata]